MSRVGSRRIDLGSLYPEPDPTNNQRSGKSRLEMQAGLMLPHLGSPARLFLIGGFLLLFIFASALGAEKQTFEAATTELLGGATVATGEEVSGVPLVSLSKSGQAVKFTGLASATKLAIHYGSVSSGTISIAVNNQPARSVNVHSSGSLTHCVLYAIIDIAIPADSSLTISLRAQDVPVDIGQIVVGDGDLGLPPDIWNLPPLPVSPASLYSGLEGDQSPLSHPRMVA